MWNTVERELYLNIQTVTCSKITPSVFTYFAGNT